MSNIDQYYLASALKKLEDIRVNMSIEVDKLWDILGELSKMSVNIESD